MKPLSSVCLLCLLLGARMIGVNPVSHRIVQDQPRLILAPATEESAFAASGLGRKLILIPESPEAEAAHGIPCLTVNFHLESGMLASLGLSDTGQPACDSGVIFQRGRTHLENPTLALAVRWLLAHGK